MKIALAVVSVVAVLALVAAGTFATLYFTDDDEGVAASSCGDRIYGHIDALGVASGLTSGGGDMLQLRFDPAWFTSGVTANTAAAEDGVVEPGEPVPNDNYRVEEGHRLLTYLVPPDAKVTVLTRQGDPANFGSTPITVDELTKLVAGGKPVELFEPLDTGVWIRVDGDTVCALDQQYQP